MKHNNNNSLLNLQAWPVRPCKNQKTSFKNSPLIKVHWKKLTEELSRTKKVKRRKKVLAGKEHAGILTLYLPLRVIYFSNLSKGFEFSKNCYFYGTVQNSWTQDREDCEDIRPRCKQFMHRRVPDRWELLRIVKPRHINLPCISARK